MIIRKIKNEPDALWQIEGIIDSDNYHDFENEILALNYDNITLTIDMREVPYITSAAIRVLLVARKHIEKENLIILNANNEVKEIFNSTGFTDMLTFKYSKDDKNDYKSFKSLLDEAVSSSPDSEAFIMGNERYTWKDIDKCSQIIASDLSSIGVKKGSHVGIISTNSINWVSTFFAIQKLGAVACPMNFNSKKEEVISLSSIGDIQVLCYGTTTSIDDANNFFENEITKSSSVKGIYCIDRTIDFRKRYNEYENIKDKFSQKINADDPALVIFTSGSTGKPKAVLSSSYNRIVFLSENSINDGFEASNDFCLLIYLPLFHIFAITQCFIKALLYKAKVCIAENTKPDTILNLIEKEKCTFLPTVPTFISKLINYDGFKKERVSTIKYILFGGEPINEKQVKECNEKFVNAKISNGYGMSEITPISNSLYGDTFDHLTKTVGRIHNYIDLKIADTETGEFLPNGKVGEICVKSEGIMIGYYKLDIDAQSLDSRGYIRTGDLGYVCDDGYLVLTGRCKELIIRSGENISPNEIANAISGYEDIANVKVYGVPDEKYGETVAAAVIMKDGKILDKDKINDYLSDKIAKFKMPEYYVEFKAFPLLSNNKIDGVTIRKTMIDSLGLKS